MEGGSWKETDSGASFRTDAEDAIQIAQIIAQNRQKLGINDAHAYGELVIHNDADWILKQVTRLTNRFEKDQPKPWSVDQAPIDYVEGQIRAIVGIELKLSRIEVSFKMSQNKSEADLDGVIAGLTKAGKSAIAAEIEKLGRK
jgi:predicted FMN-binding regulatory protein PaiB